EIPAIKVLISEDAPSPLNSLGVKGAGEGGANAAGAAIAAAIDDALGQPGAVTELPVTPQPLRALLRAAQTPEGGISPAYVRASGRLQRWRRARGARH